MNNVMYFFVEGDDDRRFIEVIIHPLIETMYADVKIITYAEKKKEDTIKFIRTIKKMGNSIVFIVDYDRDLCISFKKNILLSGYNYLKNEEIVIAKQEIESWYLAGVNDQKVKSLKLKLPRDTNGLDKEHFNLLIPNKKSRVEFMLDVLEDFSLKKATDRNHSFHYLCNKMKIDLIK